MKESTLAIGLFLNLSAAISSVIIFTETGSIFLFVLILQPLVVFFNYFKSVSLKECGALNGILVLSNLWCIAAFNIYYKCVYKQTVHGLSWGAVMAQISLKIIFGLIFAVVLFVAFECIISLVIKAHKVKKESEK